MNPLRSWLLKATDRVHARLAGTYSLAEGQEELERYVQVLTHYLTHDLRGPIRTIEMLAIALREDLSEESPERDYAWRIAEAARRMYTKTKIDGLVMLDRLRLFEPIRIPMTAEMLF